MTMVEEEQLEFEVLTAIGAKIVCAAVNCNEQAVPGSVVWKRHLTALRRVMKSNPRKKILRTEREMKLSDLDPIVQLESDPLRLLLKLSKMTEGLRNEEQEVLREL